LAVETGQLPQAVRLLVSDLAPLCAPFEGGGCCVDIVAIALDPLAEIEAPGRMNLGEVLPGILVPRRTRAPRLAGGGVPWRLVGDGSTKGRTDIGQCVGLEHLIAPPSSALEKKAAGRQWFEIVAGVFDRPSAEARRRAATEELEVEPLAWVIVSDLTRCIEPSPPGLFITSADTMGKIGLESFIPGRGDAFDPVALCGVTDAARKI
jgi:hypothetical protein